MNGIVVVLGNQEVIDLNLDIQTTTNTADTNAFSGGTGGVATCATDATCNDEKSC